MKIFGIAGYKNVGKTTLIVELIEEFRRRDLRVATIKHAHHAFDIDHPGKDSYLHRKAGAEEVIVASARRFAHVRELDPGTEPALDELLGRLGSVDLVLIEGYKHGEHPKLELRRAGVPTSSLAADDPSVLAIVADVEIAGAPVPVLERAKLRAIADFIEAGAERV